MFQHSKFSVGFNFVVPAEAGTQSKFDRLFYAGRKVMLDGLDSSPARPLWPSAGMTVIQVRAQLVQGTHKFNR